jgi:hypothetical protein
MDKLVKKRRSIVQAAPRGAERRDPEDQKFMDQLASVPATDFTGVRPGKTIASLEKLWHEQPQLAALLVEQLQELNAEC